MINNYTIIGTIGLKCQANLWVIMGWESSDVVRFVLGPLLQGQTKIANLKESANSLIIDPGSL